MGTGSAKLYGRTGACRSPLPALLDERLATAGFAD